MEAEEACTKALRQHRSSKGYYRRGRARRMLGRSEDAIKGDWCSHYVLSGTYDLLGEIDLRAVLRLQPNNAEALAELEALQPPDPDPDPMSSVPSSSFQSSSSPSSSSKIRPSPPSSSTHDNPRSSNPKSSKQIPFPRTPIDNQKLKIIVVPMNVDVPVYIPTLDPEPMTPLSRTPAHIFRKEKQKLKQGGVKMRSETFLYPDWERYAVRRGTD